jgi:predicted Zn-dependent protease
MRRWHILLSIAVLASVVLVILFSSFRRQSEDVRRLAENAYRRFDFLSAHAHLLSYLKVHPDEPEVHLLAARCARRAEYLEDYHGEAPELLDMIPRHLVAAERLGTAPVSLALERMLGRAQHGELSSIEPVLVDRVKQAGADAPVILEALIHGYLRQLHFEKALVCSESLLNLDPKNIHGYLWRGRIREQLKQLRSARDDYESALRLEPDFDAARYYLAESLLRVNKVKEAEDHLQVLHQRACQNLLVRLVWAKYQIAKGDQAIGQELLDAWLTDAPKNHPRQLEALIARAAVALATDRPVDAERFARRALKESPLDQYALYDLARSLNAQGQRQAAHAIEKQLDGIKQDLRSVARYKEQLARDPTNLRLRYDIGATYLRLGRPGEAFVWLNSVLDRDPQDKPTLQILAEYHSQAGIEARASQMRQRLAAGP